MTTRREAPNTLKVALPIPLFEPFDYLPPEDFDFNKLIPGLRVLVSFQSRKLIGIIVSITNQTKIPLHKLKKITTVLDETSLLEEDIFKLCEWAKDYYHYSFGEVLMQALPKTLRKGQQLKKEFTPIKTNVKADKPLALNACQQNAVDKILENKNSFKVFLLNGVTGSGKTEVYLQVISYYLNNDQQVLILVPEISLTPQTISRFKARFNFPTLAIHSNLSEKKREEAFLMAKTGYAKIIIGTRSALFTPFLKLAIIIIDEEHDQSFKQQDHFRYHARDLAIMRAKINNLPIVLGSATPSFESLANSKNGRYEMLRLHERAGNAVLPTYEFIDLREVPHQDGFSNRLLEEIQNQLSQKKQILLFLNKRGFAPVMYCKDCSHMIACKRCDAYMVFHHSIALLVCHHCNAKIKAPTNCKHCGGSLCTLGLGTERLEITLTKYFPDTAIIRVDRDTTKRKKELEALLTKINTLTPAILIGTQMLAKGHHFPHVTLVGMIDADSGLYSTDFRAAETMGQLLMQVAGRAGRVNEKGIVMIQTRSPEHTALQLLVNEGYERFADQLLNERKQASLPPYSYMAIFNAEAHTSVLANNFLQTVKKCFADSDLYDILGPIPCHMTKRNGFYRQQLILKSTRRKHLHHLLEQALTAIPNIKSRHLVRWHLDVDPVSLG